MPGWGGILIKMVDVEETIYKVVTLILGTWSDVLIPFAEAAKLQLGSPY